MSVVEGFFIVEVVVEETEMIVGPFIFFAVFGASVGSDVGSEFFSEFFHEENWGVVVERSVEWKIFVRVGQGDEAVVFI